VRILLCFVLLLISSFSCFEKAPQAGPLYFSSLAASKRRLSL
jgi:hypothetical protein